VGFVLGFSLVFVAYGALFGALGNLLLEYQEPIQRVLGVMVILLGLAFAGWLPGLNAEWRVHMVPRYGVWGAPLLGVLFGLGWTPCIGPTLAAVQTLAFTEASAARGAVLSLAYCVGLGVPFVVLGLAFARLAGALGWVRTHYVWVMRAGGILLILIGVALVTGFWTDVTIWMRGWIAGYEVPL
jgi:cytochrome c-type biogenesis protein